MSRSIDERIVEMRFDTSQFEKGVEKTSSLLDRLKDALRLDGGKKGIDEVQAAANGFSLDGMAAGVDNISSKFSALGAIGFSVLQDLTQRAISAGGALISKIAEPILSGGRSRAMNLEQANFQFEGLGMDVEKSMESALAAVEGTAFGLDEAAVLAANFGATGMKAGDEMTDALRGVSGVASMAGAGYAEIGEVFGKVAGQGRLMGDDLNRLAARGVNAAATMAKQMGITESEFRDMVSEGEISFQMFAEGMNEAFGDQATKANETYTGSLSNMRAALARTGAAFFTPQLTRSRDLFNAITPLINRVNNAMAPLFRSVSDFLDLRYERMTGFLDGLDKWETGGAILSSVRDAVTAFATTVMSWVRPISAAFGSIFGGGTVDDVVNFIDAITAFAEGLRLTTGGGRDFQRTMAGLFAIFDIGIYIIGQVVSMVGNLINYIFDGNRAFLDMTGGVGDWLVALRDSIKSGEGVAGVLGKIEDGAKRVIDWFKGLGPAISDAIGKVGDFFGGMDFSFLDGAGDKMLGIFAPFESAGKAVSIVWTGVMTLLGSIWAVAAPAAMWVIDQVSAFIQNLADAFRSDDFDKVLDIVNTGLLGAIVLMIKDFLEGGKEAASGGFVDSIKDMFGGVTDSLTEMQNNLKASTLMQLAGAIAVLTVSVLALSLVDPVKLTAALAAITVMFTQLGVALSVMSGLVVGPAVLKMPIIAAGLILLAGALTIMAIPVMMLSRLSWEELAKGLAGVAGLLLIMAPTAAVLSGLSGSFIRIGLAMIPFALGIWILSNAVKDMAEMEWDEIGRGLTVLAGSLAAISGALMLIPSAGVLRKGASLILLGVAINLLVDPLERMGKLGWDEIGRGLTTLAGAMLIMAGGLAIMSGTIMGSAALVIAAGALHILMGPLERMSRMGWEEIGKTMTVLGGSLAILAGGLYLMSGTLLGAAGLIVAAGALMMIMDPLERMGNMSWESIGKAMTVLAGGLVLLAAGVTAMTFAVLGAPVLVTVAIGLNLLTPALEALGNLEWAVIGTAFAVLAIGLTALGIAGALLTPVIPTLLGLGIALTLMGVGLAASGAGMLLFGIGFAAVGVAVATNGQLLLDFIGNLILMIPELATALALGVAAFIITLFEQSGEIILAFGQLVSDILQEVRDRAPEFRETFVTLMLNLLIAIEEITPQFQITLATVVRAGLQTVRELAPEFATTMVVVILVMLDAIDANLPQFISRGASIVRKLIDGILSELFGMDISAGALITAFITGITSRGGRTEGSGNSIVTRLVAGVIAWVGRMRESALVAVARFILGITQRYENLKTAGATVLTKIRDGITGAVAGVVGVVKRKAEEIGAGIISGIGVALDAGSGGLFTKIGTIAGQIVQAAKDKLDSNSPSKVFIKIGEDIDEGWAIGIENGTKRVTGASSDLAKKSLGSVEEALRYFPDVFQGMADNGPVIRPVVDLSDVEAKAGRLSSIFEDPSVRGYNNASAIAEERDALQRSQQERAEALEQRVPEIRLEQTNNSPKALDHAEIYRNTKNLLSTAKGALQR